MAVYYDDWEKRQAYERGREEERDRIRRAVDGDEGSGCFGLIVLCVIVYFVVQACTR
ncbi:MULTISPECIES: hypothetical protein [unclassified Streptomyces]|uniref:hypothetical protein n=1 Tax=unclassified Streptomyces TaxID=2593676 RepID=UPI001660D52A|nr:MULTISPECIES: hypothetical protein [unclassified Streptomyces]